MGSPLSNVCQDFSREAWLEYKDIPYLKQKSVTVHRGRAQSIDPSGRTATFIDASNASQRISYDFLVIANGTRRAWPVVPKAFTKELYLNDGDRHSSRLAAARTVAVIGGGKQTEDLSNNCMSHDEY
jgi:NADPH-dependent 2,4-dienoyl-CoA reductase/sulfur reductase-like enzyme